MISPVQPHTLHILGTRKSVRIMQSMCAVSASIAAYDARLDALIHCQQDRDPGPNLPR